jgi:hypothetical protein
MDYNKTFVLPFNIAATAAGIEAMISFPNAFLIRKIFLVTRVAGVAATHRIELQNSAGSINYSTITPGTTVASTLMQGSEITEANRVFAGGTILRLFTTNNESTGRYTIYVVGAHQE